MIDAGPGFAGRVTETLSQWRRADPAAEVDSPLMARSLGVVGITGCALVLLWDVLPGPPHMNRTALAILAVIGLGVGLVLASGLADRTPPSVFEGAVLLATVLTSLAVYFVPVRGAPLILFYLWCTPYAYWFFARIRAMLQALFVVLGFSLAKILSSLAHPALAGHVSQDWGSIILLAGTVLVSGELVYRMRVRISRGQTRFERIFADAPTPMARVNSDLRYIDANRAFCSVLARGRSEVVGAHAFDFVPDDQRERLRRVSDDLFSGRIDSIQIERDYLRADGTRVSLLSNISMLSGPDHGAREAFVQGLDLSERRRAEEALRVSEERLRALIDNAPAVITVRDPDGRLMIVNREMARLLGVEAEELIGRSVEDLHEPEQARAYREYDAIVRETGEPVVHDISHHLDDGEHVFLTVAFPLPAARGELPLVCRIAVDVTDRERARDALVRSNEERRRLLAELVRAQEDERRRIAADVHDESIQVLAGVAIRLGLLSGMLDRPEQQRLIAGLDESVRRGIKSLRQLLFNLRLPALDELGLAAAIRTYLEETVGPEGTSYSLDDHLECEPPAELRTVLYRVAQEALSNVRKHARAGHVDVVLEGSTDGFTVFIRDDGVGFDVSDPPDEEPGHLGMVGMRERVQAAGGWIEVRSEAGHGTAVEFGVPASSEAAAEMAVVQQRGA